MNKLIRVRRLFKIQTIRLWRKTTTRGGAIVGGHKVNPKHVHTLFNVVFVKDLDRHSRLLANGHRPTATSSVASVSQWNVDISLRGPATISAKNSRDG